MSNGIGVLLCIQKKETNMVDLDMVTDGVILHEILATLVDIMCNADPFYSSNNHVMDGQTPKSLFTVLCYRL